MTRREMDQAKMKIIGIALAAALLATPALAAAALPSSYPAWTGDVYSFDWLQFELTNGQVMALNKLSIKHTQGGGAQAAVYFVESDRFNLANYHQFIFDCRGNYQALIGHTPIGPTYMPPKSTLAAVANAACER